MTIKSLSREGHSQRAIARETGHSRTTVAKVLSGNHSTKRKTSQRPSKLDDYQDYVKKRFEESGLSAVRILEELRPMGYKGSIQTLRRYIATLRKDSVRKGKATVRFETPPGKQAQADWAYCGKFPDAQGRMISVYAFVMVLSFSRKLFVHFTTSMKMSELIRCHQLAFEYLGGIPEEILYDNMKQVRISRGKWNEKFLDFAEHYGFAPKTHRAYRPRTKGKVERSVYYVKGNFLSGRSFDGLTELNAQVHHWLDHTANERIHGTTGEKPSALASQEPLRSIHEVQAFSCAQAVSRKVTWESMVHYEGSRYSVPPAHAGKKVSVLAQGGMIAVSLADTVIAEHPQAARSGQCIVDKEHIAELWRITNEHCSAPKERSWEVRFSDTVDVMPLTSFSELLS